MEFFIGREVFKTFKSRGLSLQADANRALLSVLSKLVLFTSIHFIFWNKNLWIYLIREQNYKGALDLVLCEIKERIEKGECKAE